MTLESKEKLNPLVNLVNFEMEIKVSYLKLQEILRSKDNNSENIVDFYKFCEDFFTVWGEYLKRLSPLRNEFYGESYNGYFKQIFAEILSEQYEKYLHTLQKIKVPVFLNKSFKMLLDSVNEKYKYFKFYVDDFVDSENKIERYSNELEYRFWLDIYEKNMQIKSLFKESGSIMEIKSV